MSTTALTITVIVHAKSGQDWKDSNRAKRMADNIDSEDENTILRLTQ